jgi:hypothetical protein
MYTKLMGHTLCSFHPHLVLLPYLLGCLFFLLTGLLLPLCLCFILHTNQRYLSSRLYPKNCYNHQDYNLVTFIILQSSRFEIMSTHFYFIFHLFIKDCFQPFLHYVFHVFYSLSFLWPVTIFIHV